MVRRSFQDANPIVEPETFDHILVLATQANEAGENSKASAK
jgi:hypothetical protein